MSQTLKALSTVLPVLLPVVLLAVALVYSFMFIKDAELPTVLPISDVAVIGELRFQDKSAVENIVKNTINGGYFTLDLKIIRDSLLEQPWIKDVSLRRRWPTNLDVIITEHVPVAYWNDDAFISSSGEVIKPQKIDKNLNLPVLNGPDGLHNDVWQFMNVLYQEMALLEFEVVQLDLDNRRSWQLVIVEENSAVPAATSAQPIAVKLGRFETEKRVQRFVQILPALTLENKFTGKPATGHAVGHTADNAIANNNIKVIDMRYPNGFSIQRVDAQRVGA